MSTRTTVRSASVARIDGETRAYYNSSDVGDRNYCSKKINLSQYGGAFKANLIF